MKESKYNLYVDDLNYVIVYNTFTDAIILVHKSSFEKYLKSEVDSSKLNLVERNTFEEIVKNGFLIDDNRDEFKELCFARKKTIFDSNEYNLTILPTLDCNLKCWYCFEKHLKGSRMSVEMSDRIYKYTKKIIDEKHFSHLKLELFGGEPLLYFNDDVFPLLKNIQDYYTEKGKKITLLFVTNGVYFDEDAVKKISYFDNVYIQVSIDGDRDKHDKVKFIPESKKGTFDIIIKNIQYLSDNLNNATINLRINYDNKTLLSILSIMPDILSFNRSKVKIHLERVWQTNTTQFDDTLFKNIINTFIANGFYISYSNFNRKNCACKSDKYNQAVISYEGKIFKCTGRDFNEKIEEGVFLENGDIEWKIEKISKRIGGDPFDNYKCKECKMLPLCWGPCGQQYAEKENIDIEKYCRLNRLELSLDDFVRYKANNFIMSKGHFENI